MELSVTDAAWLAGLFEGEGTFTILREERSVAITIQMTDLDVLERVRDLAGGSIIRVKKRQDHWKDCWKWTLSSQASVSVVEAMKPYLGNRRGTRALKYLELIRARNAKSFEVASLRDRVKNLRESGLTHQQIADEVGTGRSNVSHILRGRYDVV